MKKAMDQLTEQFMEARELIEDARESMETVYFSEDMTEAQEAVKSTLDQYQKLLDQLSEDQRQDVLRTIGLRMEELKAQEQALEESLHDSH
ncbi:late embryogenesis abundant protein [Elysia marginata]|uniref:Late embryogenesis abundant protein n=1 Tax=Elysia marginata TaxID=1093978 RepID=A0AAV4IZU2_9GAST|nr:late embryogenesis abundant protein [Elysia marginata]